MSPRGLRPRPSRAGLAGALLALTLLAGCSGGDDPAPESSALEASDGGGTASSDGGGASDAGGATAAAVPQDPYPATPAPEGFTPPPSCTGEGAYFLEAGAPANPALPERAGETLTVELEAIDGESAELVATIGDGAPRSVEPVTIGESVTIDLWTISVTSVCGDTEQVEFDLID
ncbi:hypothetical protein [Brachybacterium sp. YJGR34]|uniref:hypothetical protein n=1 Tax=Brachybacterium sp. YJGR34 TaxID=2059911 RepID=UPI000E0B237C|nr:hypothetical protein [Brachybacterium sp. YJGR34]